jgi:hypothetical protein
MQWLKSEENRLASFKQWPHPNIPPGPLAKTALFYYNDEDKVQCIFCLGQMDKWEISDIAHEEHAKHFPNCPFILGLPVGNVPMQRRPFWNLFERLTISRPTEAMPATTRHATRPIHRITRPIRPNNVRTIVRSNAEPERGWNHDLRFYQSTPPPSYNQSQRMHQRQLQQMHQPFDIEMPDAYATVYHHLPPDGTTVTDGHSNTA